MSFYYVHNPNRLHEDKVSQAANEIAAIIQNGFMGIFKRKIQERNPWLSLIPKQKEGG